MGDVTEDDLSRWERLCGDAKKGPFCVLAFPDIDQGEVHIGHLRSTRKDGRPYAKGRKLCEWGITFEDIEFIEESRDAVPRLIAAYRAEAAKSAELLAACERVIELNRCTAFDKYGDEDQAELWACVRILRAAIAKATAQ